MAGCDFWEGLQFLASQPRLRDVIVRGRMASTWTMVSQATQPLADLAVGYVAQALDPRTAILANGALSLAGAALLLALRPGLRTWAAGALASDSHRRAAG